MLDRGRTAPAADFVLGFFFPRCVQAPSVPSFLAFLRSSRTPPVLFFACSFSLLSTRGLCRRDLAYRKDFFPGVLFRGVLQEVKFRIPDNDRLFLSVPAECPFQS